MKLADEIIISTPKDQVYAALNDPEVLKQCTPGCEELIQHSEFRRQVPVPDQLVLQAGWGRLFDYSERC